MYLRCILVLFAFWGCSEELVEKRMAESSTRSITSVDEALGDSSIIDSVCDYELVDGTDLLLSIAMVKFNCSELLGVVSAYPTLNEEGQYTRRYYKDGNIEFNLVALEFIGAKIRSLKNNYLFILLIRFVYLPMKKI